MPFCVGYAFFEKKWRRGMIKKISTVALATLFCLPALANAGAGGGNDRVAALEKQMAEMNKAFNAQMQAMKEEIAALKSKNAEMGKEAASTSETVKHGLDAAEWTKKVSVGGQLAFRGYNVQNVWDFDNTDDTDNMDLFRTKGSLWTEFKASDDVTGRIQITNQTWGEGAGVGDNTDNKVFLDNAYINVKNLMTLPVEGTFGRQTMIYGTGFVILEASPSSAPLPSTSTGSSSAGTSRTS